MDDDEGLGWNDVGSGSRGDHPRAVQMSWLDKLMGRAVAADRSEEDASTAAAGGVPEGGGAATAAAAPAEAESSTSSAASGMSLDMLLSSQGWSSSNVMASSSSPSPSSKGAARKRSVTVTAGPWGRRRASLTTTAEASVAEGSEGEGGEGASGGGVNGGARRAPVPMLARLHSSLRDLASSFNTPRRDLVSTPETDRRAGGGSGGGGGGTGDDDEEGDVVGEQMRGARKPAKQRKWTYAPSSSPKGLQAGKFGGTSVHI